MNAPIKVLAGLLAVGFAFGAVYIVLSGPEDPADASPAGDGGATATTPSDRSDPGPDTGLGAVGSPVTTSAPVTDADEPAGEGIDDGRATASPESASPADAPAQDVVERVHGYGAMPAIDPASHPQAAAVAEALASGRHPERASPLVLPKPFDAQAYWDDPQSYLALSEPGRVWQPKQPGDDVPPLRRAAPRSHLLEQGESVELAVQTVPEGCVSFTTFDGGRFVANTLPAITVQADAQGLARATYEATGGVTDGVSILCASPFCSGTLRFSIFVEREGIASPFADTDR